MPTYLGNYHFFLSALNIDTKLDNTFKHKGSKGVPLIRRAGPIKMAKIDEFDLRNLNASSCWDLDSP